MIVEGGGLYATHRGQFTHRGGSIPLAMKKPGGQTSNLCPPSVSGHRNRGCFNRCILKHPPKIRTIVRSHSLFFIFFAKIPCNPLRLLPIWHTGGVICQNLASQSKKSRIYEHRPHRQHFNLHFNYPLETRFLYPVPWGSFGLIQVLQPTSNPIPLIGRGSQSI